MAVKDISDALVCCAYLHATRLHRWPYQLLAEWTGQPEKVCFRAMERAERRGLIEYGVSLRSGWLTDEGRRIVPAGQAELNAMKGKQPCPA